MWSLISGLFSVIGGWLGFQSKIQERDNAADMIDNRDAGRDLQEKERIQSTVEKSERTGNLEQERKEYAED